jgi:hypothetical protein
MILMERNLGGYPLDVRLEFDPLTKLQVSVRDSAGGAVLWLRNTDDGKLALSMFNHPFAYGFELTPVGV